MTKYPRKTSLGYLVIGHWVFSSESFHDHTQQDSANPAVDRPSSGQGRQRPQGAAELCLRAPRAAHAENAPPVSALRRWEETGDVLQNASMRLYRTLEQITPKDVREFFRLASLNIRRELLDLVKHYCGPQGQDARHATWHQGDDSGTRPEAAQPAGEDDPVRLAAWAEFHKQIEALPEEDREVFDLIWYQGLPQAEVAGLLNMSERTVKRRWQAARLRLYEARGRRTAGGVNDASRKRQGP